MATSDFIIDRGYIRTYRGTSSIVVIPEGVECIGNVFEGKTNITSVVLPNSLTKIGKWAFGGCTNLTSITFGKNVRLIDEYAFFNCKKLKAVTIPNLEVNIHKLAFPKECKVIIGNTGNRSSTNNTAPTKTRLEERLQKIEAEYNASRRTPSNNSYVKSSNHTAKFASITTKPSNKKTSVTTTPSKNTVYNNTVETLKFTPAYIPNQSTRMRMVKEYYSHPLRKEYEKEKDKLYKNNPMRFIPPLVTLFPWVMIIVYGFMFFSDFTYDIYKQFGVDIETAIVILGIINLFACFFSIGLGGSLKESFEKDTKGYENLKARYQQKGLYEVTESELLNAKCGELNWNDDWVCSATGEYLSGYDLNWCQTPGNCKYCRRFVQAYVGSTEYWSCEFKR